MIWYTAGPTRPDEAGTRAAAVRGPVREAAAEDRGVTISS